MQFSLVKENEAYLEILAYVFNDNNVNPMNKGNLGNKSRNKLS